MKTVSMTVEVNGLDGHAQHQTHIHTVYDHHIILALNAVNECNLLMHVCERNS